ncbi:hypothetical protein [Ectobacillus panaciterrae]|uniref:hypothetical protein n=1 Tax=Ectobacillus panaciterrae TaxID=363872 RepID=UPI0004008F8B|nr:hypothetical protein [Ectobacillus panaciterrae]
MLSLILSLISSVIAGVGVLSGLLGFVQTVCPKQFPLFIEKLKRFLLSNFIMIMFITFLSYGLLFPDEASVYLKKGQALLTGKQFEIIVSIILGIILYWIRKLQMQLKDKANERHK